MLKQYLIDGKQWQFEEGKQPDGAKEMTQEHPKAATAEPEAKVMKPANKARKVTTK